MLKRFFLCLMVIFCISCTYHTNFRFLPQSSAEKLTKDSPVDIKVILEEGGADSIWMRCSVSYPTIIIPSRHPSRLYDQPRLPVSYQFNKMSSAGRAYFSIECPTIQPGYVEKFQTDCFPPILEMHLKKEKNILGGVFEDETDNSGAIYLGWQDKKPTEVLFFLKCAYNHQGG